MHITVHDTLLRTTRRLFATLVTALDRAEAHAKQKNFDVAVLLNARLAPDMFPFTRQIQIATDNAKGAAARLAGIDMPKYEDNETTIEELRARIVKTLSFVESIEAAKYAGCEDRDVALPRRDGTLNLKGLDYFLGIALPNLYFHVTTAYAILRHNGVDLGKKDFLAY